MQRTLFSSSRYRFVLNISTYGSSYINNILNFISEHNLGTFNLKHDEVRDLLRLSLQDNYFKFNDICYMQRNCLAIGIRLAVVAANCFVYAN